MFSTCFIGNRVTHKELDKTPYKLWKGYAHNPTYLRIWDVWLRYHILHSRNLWLGSKYFYCLYLLVMLIIIVAYRLCVFE